MPRIRTIKPDFWTDAAIVELSMAARLFFIGTWTFADDSGNLEYSVPQLKMRIFPADPVDIQPLIDELTTTGVLIEYSVNGKKYLNIKNFKNHQVINKPSKTRLPAMNTTTPLPDGSGSGSGSGTEGKGKEVEGKGVTRFGPQHPVDNSTGADDGGNGLGPSPVAPTDTEQDPDVVKLGKLIAEKKLLAAMLKSNTGGTA